MTGTIDEATWARLSAEAIDAMRRAYCPYSGYPVGAAGLAEDGRIVVGSNVENAAYGCGLCAETSMISDLVRTGGGRLLAVACVNGNSEPVVPCGRCRQVLLENGGAELMVDGGASTALLGELLPHAFDAGDLT